MGKSRGASKRKQKTRLPDANLFADAGSHMLAPPSLATRSRRTRSSSLKQPVTTSLAAPLEGLLAVAADAGNVSAAAAGATEEAGLAANVRTTVTAVCDTAPQTDMVARSYPARCCARPLGRPRLKNPRRTRKNKTKNLGLCPRASTPTPSSRHSHSLGHGMWSRILTSRGVSCAVSGSTSRSTS